MPSEKEFKVNEYITLKLEDGETNIYVNNVKFYCFLGLFLNIPQDRISNYDPIELIDEAVEGLKNYTYPFPREREKYNLSAEQEFWAHCSNIQVWVENDYDMSLIYGTLGFKILMSLCDHGIQSAKERYKEELIRRFRTGHIESSFYLLEEKYHKNFNRDERQHFFLNNNPKLKANIEKILDNFDPETSKISNDYVFELLIKLREIGDHEAENIQSNYFNKIKSRNTKILTVEGFWSIIEKTYRESKGNPERQKMLIVKDLKNRSVDEIYMYGKFFSNFTRDVYSYSHFHDLAKEFNIYTDESSWLGGKGHIVALGKETYELAFYEKHKFKRNLRARFYGDPKDLDHNFWGVIYEAFKQKTGITTYTMEDFISDGLILEKDLIFKDLYQSYVKKKDSIDKQNRFKINDYLTLKLENGKTNIYIKGNLFQQCKSLLLNIPADNISSFDQIDSIDEIAEILNSSLEGSDKFKLEITPEVEFWGHCSNMQVWAEMNYDVRFIHSNLSFHLLKKLTEVGDIQAKRVFKAEVMKRFDNGNQFTQRYLFDEGLLRYLNKQELFPFISRVLKDHREFLDLYKVIFGLLRVMTDAGDNQAKIVLKEEITGRFENEFQDIQQYIYNEGYLEYLDKQELFALISSIKTPSGAAINLFVEKGLFGQFNDEEIENLLRNTPNFFRKIYQNVHPDRLEYIFNKLKKMSPKAFLILADCLKEQIKEIIIRKDYQ